MDGRVKEARGLCCGPLVPAVLTGSAGFFGGFAAGAASPGGREGLGGGGVVVAGGVVLAHMRKGPAACAAGPSHCCGPDGI